MKKLILLIGILFLFSCSNRFPANNNNEDVIYVIDDISKVYEKGVCDYHITTKVTHTYWQNNFTIYDSVGKFKIGDTIYLKPYTK